MNLKNSVIALFRSTILFCFFFHNFFFADIFLSLISKELLLVEAVL